MKKYEQIVKYVINNNSLTAQGHNVMQHVLKLSLYSQVDITMYKKKTFLNPPLQIV